MLDARQWSHAILCKLRVLNVLDRQFLESVTTPNRNRRIFLWRRLGILGHTLGFLQRARATNARVRLRIDRWQQFPSA